jgi:DNA replication and repair protein RecF
MRIKALFIAGFRNLKKTSLSFDPDTPFVAFVGPNGQGKTNVLESLFLLGISKSFRTLESEDMIGFDDEFFTIKGEIECSDGPLQAEVIVSRKPLKKTLKLNGATKKASEFIGNVGVVFFSPDDLGMIHLSPSLRRRYLDLLLSQLDRGYLESALKYQSALKQRNSLLRLIGEGRAQEGELEFWDHELSASGSNVLLGRAKVLDRISAFAGPFYRDATGTKDELKIDYLPSGNATDAESLLSMFQKNHARDIALGATQSGPHRDDLRFLVNGHDLASFGSRGEWRSLVLTLKFAEIELLREKYGEAPILLLDDVFSELDEARQKTLFNSIRGCQTFMTTTHREFLDTIKAKKQVFFVENGSIQMGRD